MQPQTKGFIMKCKLFSGIVFLMAGAMFAADSTPKESVTNAVKKLAEKANYSWKTTVVVPENAPFRPGPTEGKTEKDGFTHVTMNIFDNTMQFVLKGGKGAFTGQDGGWQSVAEAEGEEGPGRFMAMMVQNYRTPAVEASELASFTKELTKDGDVYASDLTEEGAKTFLTFRRRAGGGEGPTVTNPKGSVKFWLKDGIITKYEFKVKGTVKWGENEFENDRTTTVEIKDVDATKLSVPEEAKKKLS
jgi:hypothetical protein